MLWHNRAGDYPLTMPGSPRLAGMESARTGEPRSGGGGDRSSARSKYKPAAPRHSAGDSSGIRNGRGPVHRRERWWPRGAATKTAPEKELSPQECRGALNMPADWRSTVNARLVPGSGLHRGASNQEKAITIATSRDAVMASC